MTTQNREQWIALLDAAQRSPENLDQEDWQWLMRQLGLPLNYYLAVGVALTQGRWREAKNPKAYLKTVVKREARNMGLDKDMVGDQISLPRTQNGRQMPYEEALEKAMYASGTSAVIKSDDGVWRRGEGWADDDFDYDGSREEFESFRDFLVSKVPDDLKVAERPPEHVKAAIEAINNKTQDFHIHLKDHVSLNWELWADIAGFDRWEKLVLACRCTGKSRDRALAEQPDEQSRRALQAAWRRFDRSGMTRLREAAKNNPK